ncbi:uncharacterized protein MELLADRAFT_117797 [Melampsora larici-populina 98AG31]|uniref:Uncharacterized protein n=1 Tax=Melampsora larici-populina (strain 98AG31 / pathotype 3-4-7) TaxID=747676 RepID=F4S1N0_MELLP|nr:uncharacterized protein MELLADRAFT_117797 [Melampsora larici-populina 98AG31]EGG01478.1 hypothetical protein MELLADRAFT_117797 [Melampsora larici-populina 98AG31]
MFFKRNHRGCGVLLFSEGIKMLISEHPSGRIMNANMDDPSQSSKHQRSGSASMILQGREKYGLQENRSTSSIINYRGASHHLMSSTSGSIGRHSGVMYPYEKPSNSNGPSKQLTTTKVISDQNQLINKFDKFYQHSSYSRPTSTSSIKVTTRHPQSLIRTTGITKPIYNNHHPHSQEKATASSQSSSFSRSSLDRNSFIPTPIRHQSHPYLSRHSTTSSAFQPDSISSSLPRSNTSSHHQESHPFSNPNTTRFHSHSTNRITTFPSPTTQQTLPPSSSSSSSFRTVNHLQSSQSPIGSSSSTKLVASRPNSSHHSSLFPTPMSTNIINLNNANKLHSHFSSPPNRLANSPPSPHQQQKHYQMSPPFAPSSHQQQPHSLQHHHPGPTLPPLRPIHSSQAANPQPRHLLPSPSNSSRHHSQSISPVVPPRLPPPNSLEDPSYQASSSSRRRSSLVPWARSNQSEDVGSHPQARHGPSHDPPTSQALKRTASRAELDRPQTNLGPPPPLPAPFDQRRSPHTHQKSTSQADFSDPNQSASSNNRAPTMEEEMEATDEVSVKPEYLTPHLPPQPLPAPLGIVQRTSSHHSDVSSCRSSITPDPEGYAARGWHGSHQPDQHQPTSNLAKKRRVTITDDRLSRRNHDSQSPHTLAPLTISTSPPQPRSNSSTNGHGGSNNNDPVSPLVIGFTQPHNADAMQQMANTIKLRDEQKRLIEQRRNSFAGPASNAFPGSLTLPARSSGTGMPPPANHPHIHGRSPPGGSHARSGSHRGSISKTTSHPSNGHAKTLSNSSVAHHHHHHHHPSHPPVINLKPISEAAHPKPQQSQSQRPYISGPQTSSCYSPTYENDPCVDPSAESPNSTIASRRGQVAREKVKNLAITPHAFRPHVMLQPSIKSAPIRSGFLQATAPNGDVVKTPLIARTNLASSTNGVQQHNTSQHQQNSQHTSSAHPLRSSHGPSSHHQSNPQSGQNGAPPDGLGRRMTMHSGVPLQVPTLTHVPMFNSKSNSNSNHGRVNGHVSSYGNSVNLMAGPRTAMPSFGGPSMQQQLESSRLRGGGGSSHGAVHSPAYHPYPQPNSHSHQSPPEPHPSSQQTRPSIGSHSSGPTSNSSNQIPPKQMFLQLFDTFYDSLADSRILQSNLEEQIRRSAQLLGLLQQSSTVFEKMLDERVGAVQAEYTRDLQILESRLDRLEAEKERRGDDEGERREEADLEVSKQVNSQPPVDQAGGAGTATTAGARLERLEREIPVLRKDGADKSNQTSTPYYYSNSRSGFVRQSPLPPQPTDENTSGQKPTSSESTRPTADQTDEAT